MVLFDVWGIALEVGAMLVDRPEGERGLVNFRAVLMAAAGQDNSKDFFTHRTSSVAWVGCIRVERRNRTHAAALCKVYIAGRLRYFPAKSKP